MKRNNKEQLSASLDNLPVKKYEGIDMAPVAEFVRKYLQIESYTPRITEFVFRLWLQNNGFLGRLSSFSLMNTQGEGASLQARNYLAVQFLRQFRDQILPDFFPGGKVNSGYKSASRMCNSLIVFSKTRKGKDIIFAS